MSAGPNQFAPAPEPHRSGAPSGKTTGDCCVSVEEGYRRWAPSYDLDLNPLLALEERQLKTLLPCLTGKCVLDLACGTGRWLTRLLADGATSGVGLDNSAAMLERAREKAGLRNRLVRADSRSLPFAEGAFDLVVCSFALGHLFELESTAQEVARVTVPGAAVYLSDLHPQAYSRGWRTRFRDRLGAVEIQSRPHSIGQVLAAWESAGFKWSGFTEFRLGEPERPIFARAGKAELFVELSRVPAVLILHFQRAGQPRTTREPGGNP